MVPEKVIEQRGVIRQLEDIVSNGVIFKHYEVEDACFIHEKQFHVFSWKKGCVDEPHYKSYAYTMIDDDCEDGRLIVGIGIDQNSLEGAGQEAVDSVLETTLYDFTLDNIISIRNLFFASEK